MDATFYEKLYENIMQKTLYEALTAGAAINENAPVLLYKGKAISYRAFLHRIDLTASALKRAGVKKGEVVAISLPNIPKIAILLYALNKIGAVAHLNHVLDTSAQTVKNVQKTGAKLLFVLDVNAAKLTGFCQKNGVRLVSCCPADELGAIARYIYRKKEKLTKKALCGAEDFNAFIKGAQVSEADLCRSDPRETAVLLNSGGTTGEPKTVEFSAAAMNAEAAILPDILRKADYSYTYMMSPLPIFHCFGLLMGLHAMVTANGCNVLMPRFSRKETIAYLKKGKINFMLGVPAIYDALLSSPDFNGAILKHVDIAFVGGDSVRPATQAEFNKRMREANSRGRLFEGYGLSETLSVCCVGIHDRNRENSLGKPVPGARVQVAKTPESEVFFAGLDKAAVRSAALPAGADLGELCVAGDTLMRGYYQDAAATAPAFLTGTDGTRWLKTGDAGAVDADGFIYFLGRMKHIIKVSGESVFPREIESAARAVTGVKECAAFGVPDERTGSRVMLAVVAESGADESELRARLEKTLGELLYKNARPKGVVFYESLPKTKMQKTDIAKLIAENAG